MGDLQQRFEALDQLAKNPEMIERVRSSKTDPLSDMWHVININKRLDACEKGIEKLATMLQDLIKGDKIETGSEAAGSSEEVNRLNERIVELENQLGYLSGDVANLLSNVTAQESAEDPKTNVSAAGPAETSVKAKDSVKAEKIIETPNVNEPESNEPSAANNPEAPAAPSVDNDAKSPKDPSPGNNPNATETAAAKEGTKSKKTGEQKSPGNSTGQEKPKLERRSVIGKKNESL